MMQHKFNKDFIPVLPFVKVSCSLGDLHGTRTLTSLAGHLSED